MKITDTISVNPSKTTLGHVESQTSTIFRSPVLGVESSNNSLDIFSLVFPSCKAASNSVTKYEVPLRTLFATILIVTGITLLEAAMSPAMAICSLCFGAVLALGLCTRPVMAGASVFYCIMGALSLRSGYADISLFSLMFGSLFFTFNGAGKYSCDQLIRGSYLRHLRLAAKKNSEKVLGYKAFHSVNF